MTAHAERADEGERRRVFGLFAFAGSSAIHVALYFAVVIPPPPHGPELSALAPGEYVDIAVPGLGPPGAPAGDAAQNTEADELTPMLDVPAVPPPRAREPSPRVSTDAVPTTISDDGTPADVTVASAPAEVGSPTGDALIDALIARSSGEGSGAGGSGGAGCPDPIAGTWHARKYKSAEGWWSSFTLHIERDGDRLSGRVVQHGWTGGPRDTSPPMCTPGIFEHRVRMGGEGFLRGDHVRFDAEGPPERTVLCMGTDLGYNLDHFTGTLRGNRLLAVNNDGGRDVNAPYTFRRTRCD